MFSTQLAHSIFAQHPWFAETLENLQKERFFIFFNALGRKISNEPLSLEQGKIFQKQITEPVYGFSYWSQQDVARMLTLWSMQERIDSESFYQLIEQQFHAGTPLEQVSMLKSLVFLNNPNQFEPLARFATRSNVAEVFLAIAHQNPFPKTHFDETGWNQLILKALFNGFELAKIIGLKERNNVSLSESLRQFALERQAAGRPVSEEIWPLANAFAQQS